MASGARRAPASQNLADKVVRHGVERVQPPHPPERQRHRSRLAGSDVRHRRWRQRRRLRQPSEHRRGRARRRRQHRTSRTAATARARPTSATSTARSSSTGSASPIRQLASLLPADTTLGYSGPNYWTVPNFNHGLPALTDRWRTVWRGRPPARPVARGARRRTCECRTSRPPDGYGPPGGRALQACLLCTEEQDHLREHDPAVAVERVHSTRRARHVG